MSGIFNETITGTEFTKTFVGENVTALPPSYRGIIHNKPFLATLFFFALFSNGTILCSVFRLKQFRRSNNYMVGNLAAIALYRLFMVSILALLKTGRVEISHQIPCKLFGLFYRATHPLEGFTLVCISFERCCIAKNPWRKITRERTWKRIFFVWMSSFLLKSPNLLFWNVTEIDTLGKDNKVHTTFQCSNTMIIWGSYKAWTGFLVVDFVLVTLLPALFLLKELALLSVALKFLNLRRLSEPAILSDDARKSHQKLAKEQRRVVRNAVTFICLFLTDYLPLGTFLVFYQFPRLYLSEPLYRAVVYVKPFFYTLGTLHCAFFPLLVVILSKNLRKHFKLVWTNCIK